jgi:hypothetical protein
MIGAGKHEFARQPLAADGRWMVNSSFYRARRRMPIDSLIKWAQLAARSLTWPYRMLSAIHRTTRIVCEI